MSINIVSIQHTLGCHSFKRFQIALLRHLCRMPQVCSICWEAFWAPKCPLAENQTMSCDIGDYDFVSMTQEPPINMTDTSIEYCITQWHEHNEHITYIYIFIQWTMNICELCWLCSILLSRTTWNCQRSGALFSRVWLRSEFSEVNVTVSRDKPPFYTAFPNNKNFEDMVIWSVYSFFLPHFFHVFPSEISLQRDLLSFVVESNSDVEHRNWTSNLWFHLDMCERCGQRSSDLGNSFLPAVTKCEKRTWQQIHFFSSSLHLVKTGVIIEAGDGDFEVSTKS